MSSFNTSNEDLYAKGRRLYDRVMSLSGTGPEVERAHAEWTTFWGEHPEIAKEVSRSRSNSSYDSIDGSVWNEAAENLKYTNGEHWATFSSTGYTGEGFSSSINRLICHMRGQYQKMERNQSQYGETYLVGWALHHMPTPVKDFTKWSMEQEEPKEETCQWTIEGFRQHLYTWAKLFSSDMTLKYCNNALEKERERFRLDSGSASREQEFYLNQYHIGGGPTAHFLHSRAEHRRWAYQMFKTMWRESYEAFVEEYGGKSRDVIMMAV